MRLICLPDKEPDCLKNLRESGYHYSDLKDGCRFEVEESISKSQQRFCAYCEQKFKSKVHIEPYIPQSKCKDLELVYENFLGVCSGKEYLNLPQYKKDHLRHCGESKGKEILTLNPKNPKHISAIYYENDGVIKSKIQNHNHDLNYLLNLNLDFLKTGRLDKFRMYLLILFKFAKKLNLNKIEAYKIGLENAKNGEYEFAGYISFMFN